MATAFLPTATTFIPSPLSSSSSYCPPFSTPTLVSLHKDNPKRQLCPCKVVSQQPPSSPVVTKRSLSICLFSSFVFTLAGQGFSHSNAAILEADDDEELLEKVKKDRKKRLERQGVVNSSNQETGYLQELVYKLSTVGQAIEKNDLSTAGSVLGGSTDSDWVKKANIAFTKFSYSPEEKTEVDTFNSSLASLISSVSKNDVDSSKTAFVTSASAFEKWTNLTGFVTKLKGL
ncbi:hypothetical protein UlMin_045582 [Ulmus minor]